MQTDPVCGMEVDEKDALIAVRGGRKNFFCSNECRDEFLKNKS
ncbi:TPA: YHS domain-containing protein [Candidatus Woesearchaeota archaeon]|nr:YHS domain-containing protein [Candidatus Woesearchaeota archaeon]